MPLRMTRLAVSRALVSAVEPPEAKTDGELAAGLRRFTLKTGREIKGDLAAASGEIFPLFFWGGGGVGGVIVARDRWLVAGGEVDGASLRKKRQKRICYVPS